MVSKRTCGIITESLIKRVSGVFNSGCRASRRFSRYDGEQLVKRSKRRERVVFMAEDIGF